MKLDMSERSSMRESRIWQGPTLLDRLRLRRAFGSDNAPVRDAISDRDATPVGNAPANGCSFQLIDQLQFIDALVAIFGPETAEMQRMKAQIESVGGTVMLISQLDLPEAWLARYAPRLTCCIVGHEFADYQAASDFCLMLRRITAELAIVLALPGTAPHDFSPALQPVCDTRLRRPVSRTPLLLGIQAARDNRTARQDAATAPPIAAGRDRRSAVGQAILA